MALTRRDVDSALPDTDVDSDASSPDPELHSMTDDTNSTHHDAHETPAEVQADDSAGADAAKPKLTRAERLEAKAARLREAELARQRKAAEAAANPSSAKAPLPWVIATGVLAFLLALTLALGIPYALQKRSAVHHNAALNTARSQTVDLARKVALATASYDYRHVTADLDKAMAYMTPSYKRVYQGIAAKLGPLVVQAKAISTGSVLNYGVRSLTTTHAVVVLFLDQNVKQDGSSAPARPSHYRAIITMDKLGGHWLVSLLQLT